EYMAAGIPVIASHFPLWREIVEDNGCGLCVNPQDPEEIAQAVRYVLTYPQQAEEMGRRGRKAVEEKYNWRLEAQNLFAIYRDLLHTVKAVDRG
ncbi:MAG: glycosyltransferase, partial [Pseudomonadota bacterium]